MREVIVIALVLAACGERESSGPKLVGGCDHRAGDGYCREYWGTGTPAEAKAICAQENVPYVDKCPAEKAIGRCVNEAGTILETHAIWYGDRVTREFVAQTCKPPLQLRGY